MFSSHKQVNENPIKEDNGEWSRETQKPAIEDRPVPPSTHTHRYDIPLEYSHGLYAKGTFRPMIGNMTPMFTRVTMLGCDCGASKKVHWS